MAIPELFLLKKTLAVVSALPENDARRRGGISGGLGLGFAIMRLFSMRQERLSLRHDPI